MRELQRPLCVAAVFKEAESRWRIDTAKSASRDLRLLLQCIREDRRPDRRRTEERPRIVQHERGVAQVDVRLAIRSAALAILCDTKELKIYRLRPSRTAIDIVQNTVRGREGELADVHLQGTGINPNLAVRRRYRRRVLPRFAFAEIAAKIRRIILCGTNDGRDLRGV